jgi:flagellar FliL protein
MAEDVKASGTEQSESTLGAVPPKKGVPFLIPLIIVGIILLGVGVVFLTPLKDKLFSHAEKKQESVDLMELAFLPLPEVIVNLKAHKGKAPILKAQFIVQLVDMKDKETIDHIKPLIIDQFQTYLRELELADVEGSTGAERVRQELQNRVSNLVAPRKIRQVLIKDFLIQ